MLHVCASPSWAAPRWAAVARLAIPARSRGLTLVLALAILDILFGSPCPANARAASVAAPATVSAAAVVAAARSFIGAPYAHIGDDPHTGFSCIGFVHYLYGRFGVDVPYGLSLAYQASPRVDAADLEPGDLVFFSNTVWPGLSHVALYAGNGAIIGADNFQTGVELTHLSDPYWQGHYTGATRPLATTATVGGTAPVAHTPIPGLSARVGQVLSGHAGGDVYSGPGYGYPRVDRLAAGMRLQVVDTQGTWTDVAYDGPGSEYAGWVDAAYLNNCTVLSAAPSAPAAPAAPAVPPARPKPAPRSPAPPAVTHGAGATVIAALLMLRAGPSTVQRVIKRLHRGERVAVLGQQGDWERVQSGSTTGWAAATWLAPSP